MPPLLLVTAEVIDGGLPVGPLRIVAAMLITCMIVCFIAIAINLMFPNDAPPPRRKRK